MRKLAGYLVLPLGLLILALRVLGRLLRYWINSRSARRRPVV